MAADLRARAFRHVQSLSMRHHTRASTGDTVQRLVGDVSRLQEVAVTAGLPLLGNMATLVADDRHPAVAGPLLSLVVFLAGGVFVLLSRASSGPITAAAGNSRKGEGHLATTAAQTLGAIREVQAYGLEDDHQLRLPQEQPGHPGNGRRGAAARRPGWSGAPTC